MPNIFGGYPGRVIAVDSGDNFYTPLGLIAGNFKTNLGAKALITGLDVNGQSGFQVMHSLRQYLYIYTFCERAGEMTISGLCFVNDCSGTNSITGTALYGGGGASGLARLYDWYERYRISTTGAPIVVTLTPNLTLQAFLVGFKYQVEDPSISLAQFQIRLFYPPRLRTPGSPSAFPPVTLAGSEWGEKTIIQLSSL